MLTREEAKKKECPIKMGNPKLLRSEYKCKAENCPKWRDSEDYKMHCVGGYAYKKTFNPPVEEHCTVYHKSFTPHQEDCYIEEMFEYLEHCNKCPKRYGYCGG